MSQMEEQNLSQGSCDKSRSLYFCGRTRKKKRTKGRRVLLERAKKGRREGNEAASSSFASSRLLNHSLAHWQKLPHMTSHGVANNKVPVKDWNKVGNSQQSQSTSERCTGTTHTHTRSRLCCKHRSVVLSWKGKWIQTPPVVLYVSTGYCLLHQMTNINFHQTIRPLSLTLSLSGCVSFPFLLAFPRLRAPGMQRAAIWSPGPTFTATMGPVLDAQFIKEKNEMAGEWDRDRGELCGWM